MKGKGKMNKNIKRLIAIGTLTGIIEIYRDTFSTARMYEMAGNSIQTISIYYMVEYFCIVMTFLLLGSKIKAFPMKALRIGIILNLALLTAIMLFDDDIMRYYIPFAIVVGVAMGTYYSPFAVLVGIYNDNAIRYCTISKIFNDIVSMVFPVTIGVYINNTSFISVTICIMVVSVIQIVISLGIENVVVTETKCDIINFLKYVKSAKNGKKIFNYYKIGFFNGIVSSVLDRTVLLLIMMVFGSSMQLGILNTLFAIFSIFTTWLIKKYYKGKKSKTIIAISAVMPLIAVMVLFVRTSTSTVIFYRVINSVFICILSMMTNIERYDCLDEDMKKVFVAEHQAMAEVTLGIGRIFGLLILLIMSIVIGGLYAIMIMLIIISFSIIAYAWLIAKQ